LFLAGPARMSRPGLASAPARSMEPPRLDYAIVIGFSHYAALPALPGAAEGAQA